MRLSCDQPATEAQRAELDVLSEVCGYDDADTAAAEVLERDVDEIEADGLSEDDADTVIETLREDARMSSGGVAGGIPEDRWAAGSAGVAGLGYVAGSSGFVWLFGAFAVIFGGIAVAERVSDYRGMLRSLRNSSGYAQRD